MLKTPLVTITLSAFLWTAVIGPMPMAMADEFHLPVPGVMVHLSPPLDPPILKGIKVHPENPFQFEFILDQGDSSSSSDNPALKQEASKLIKYFLSSLTIPDKDLWVNLSPYEKDRIIPQSFGRTEMGRDLLAEDYMLKQITASLFYPEVEIGKKFWKRIYAEAARKYGTTNIPVNTFNKVWIVPDKAIVYENVQAGTAYVVESKLKVMLEQDYLSLEKHSVILSSAMSTASAASQNDVNALGSQIVREIVLPELTKEVNENKNFAQLRQVYNSLILAAWYKKKIKDSILARVYEDRKKVVGVGYNNSVILSVEKDLNKTKDSSPLAQNDIELIYHRYLKAFKKGVYNYIKEDNDPITQEMIPRKYFSGGFDMEMESKVEGSTNLNSSALTFTHQSSGINVGFTKKILLSVTLAASLAGTALMPASLEAGTVGHGVGHWVAQKPDISVQVIDGVKIPTIASVDALVAQDKIIPKGFYMIGKFNPDPSVPVVWVLHGAFNSPSRLFNHFEAYEKNGFNIMVDKYSAYDSLENNAQNFLRVFTETSGIFGNHQETVNTFSYGGSVAVKAVLMNKDGKPDLFKKVNFVAVGAELNGSTQAHWLFNRFVYTQYAALKPIFWNLERFIKDITPGGEQAREFESKFPYFLDSVGSWFTISGELDDNNPETVPGQKLIRFIPTNVLDSLKYYNRTMIEGHGVVIPKATHTDIINATDQVIQLELKKIESPPSVNRVAATGILIPMRDEMMQTALPRDNASTVMVEGVKIAQVPRHELINTVNEIGAGLSVGLINDWKGVRVSMLNAGIKAVVSSTQDGRAELEYLLQPLSDNNENYPTEALFASLEARFGPKILTIIAKPFSRIIPGEAHRLLAKHLIASGTPKMLFDLNFDNGAQKSLIALGKDIVIKGIGEAEGGRRFIRYQQLHYAAGEENITSVGEVKELELKEWEDIKNVPAFERFHMIASSDTPFETIKILLRLGIPIDYKIHGDAEGNPEGLITNYKGTGNKSFPKELKKLLIYFLGQGIPINSIGISGGDPDVTPFQILALNVINGNEIPAENRDDAKEIRTIYEDMFPLGERKTRPGNVNVVVRSSIVRLMQGATVQASASRRAIISPDAYTFLRIQVGEPEPSVPHPVVRKTPAHITDRATEDFTRGLADFIREDPSRRQGIVYVMVSEAFAADPMGELQQEMLAKAGGATTVDQIYEDRKAYIGTLLMNNLLEKWQAEDLMGTLERNRFNYRSASDYFKVSALALQEKINNDLLAFKILEVQMFDQSKQGKTKLENKALTDIVHEMGTNPATLEKMCQLWRDLERLFFMVTNIHNLNLIDSRYDFTLEQQRPLIMEYMRLKGLKLILNEFKKSNAWEHLDSGRKNEMDWIAANSDIERIKIELMVVLPGLPIVQEPAVLAALGEPMPVTEAEQKRFTDTRIDELEIIYGKGSVDATTILDTILNIFTFYVDSWNLTEAGRVLLIVQKFLNLSRIHPTSTIYFKYQSYLIKYRYLLSRTDRNLNGEIIALTSESNLSRLKVLRNKGWWFRAAYYRMQAIFDLEKFKLAGASQGEVKDLLNQSLDMVNAVILTEGDDLTSREIGAIYYIMTSFMKYYAFMGMNRTSLAKSRELISALGKLIEIIKHRGGELIGEGINQLPQENYLTLQAFYHHLNAMLGDRQPAEVTADFNKAQIAYHAAEEASIQQQQTLAENSAVTSAVKRERSFHARLGLMQLWLDALESGGRVVHHEGDLQEPTIRLLEETLVDLGDAPANPHRNAKMVTIWDRLVALRNSLAQAPHARLQRLEPQIKALRDVAALSKGGIDFTPAKMHLQTQSNGVAIKFHLDAAQLARLENATGFVPVSIKMQPMTDLFAFLGVKK